MRKIFFNNRYIAITTSYEECTSAPDSVVYILRAERDLPWLLKLFDSYQQLPNLWIYTELISEEQVYNRLFADFEKVEAAGGLTRNTKGEVLMIHRYGHWDLPKGKLEKSESIEEAALREVEEECSLSGLSLYGLITKTYHVYKIDGRRYVKITSWFSLQYGGYSEPKPQLEEGIDKAEWVSIAKLSAYLPLAYCSVKEVFREAGIE